MQGRTIIARNVNWTLPGYLRHAIDSPIVEERLIAVDGLAHLHEVGNATVRARSRAELDHLTHDDSRRVSAAATERLRATDQPAPAGPEPARPEPPAPAAVAVPEPLRPAEPEPTPTVAETEPAARPPGEVAAPDRRRRNRVLVAVAAAIVVVIAVVTTAVAYFGHGSSHATNSASSGSSGSAYPITPPGLAVSPDGRWVYAAVNQLAKGGGTGASMVVALDVKARAARGQLEYLAGAGDAVISPDGQKLYVADRYSPYHVGLIHQLGPQPSEPDMLRFTATEGPPSNGDRSLAISRDGSRVYLTDDHASTVSVATTSGHESSQVIQVSGGARRLVMSPDGQRLYIVGQALSWLDTATGKLTNGTLSIGGDPRDVAISPDGRRLYVADRQWNYVNVVDIQANKITDSIRPGCGTGPVSIELGRDGSRLYTACETSNVVSVNDTATGSAIGTPVTVGDRPSTMVLSPDGGRLYVATISGYDVRVATVDTAAGTAIQPPITVAPWLVSPSPSASASATA